MIDRRKFLSIGLIGISSVALSACSPVKKQEAVEYYHEEAYGIIDTTGRWVIEPKFDWISTPVKGLCTASLFSLSLTTLEHKMLKVAFGALPEKMGLGRLSHILDQTNVIQPLVLSIHILKEQRLMMQNLTFGAL